MKRCPSCQRSYQDNTLVFCLEDGTSLVSEALDEEGLPATLVMADPRLTLPQRPETARPNPPAQVSVPQAYAAQQSPAWSPAVQPLPPPMYHGASVRQGRGVSLIALICAIAAFVLLGFCIIAGAADVNADLIGGIFIFSALVGLLGAVLGIVGLIKTGRDTSAQNSRPLAIVSLVLNGLYLLVV
ncbi:MAG TPA: hypothetical protein VEV81_09735, partial [Pyrinomonadaceae bacterium]|nr:hypothetical protein [Pyrinomonadaceae bacterium]